MPPRATIVLASQNPGKIREIRQVLAPVGVDVIGLDAFGDIPEPAEDGSTFGDNARGKALYYARKTGLWCLADDSGLVVDALDGRPGVHSARYAADELPADAGRSELDAANNAKLLRQLTGTPAERRSARFVCHLALADPERILIETFDTVEGRIADFSRGDNGFGYDPLFYLPQLGCTSAELPAEQKNAISHRGKALRHLADLLRSLLEGKASTG